MITLVTGGIRSGKSAFAEAHLPGTATYLATGAIPSTSDESWARRVRAHQDRRPAAWETIETHDVPAALAGATGAVLLDDVGNWLAAQFDELNVWSAADSRWRGNYASRVEALLDALRCYPSDIVIVTSEVGLTLVPTTAAGRLFADELGSLNQALAAASDTVVLVVAGCPLAIKGTL